jgi:ATP-dependent DNA helicase RecG
LFLIQPITVLKGVGSQRRALFERLLGTRVVDALQHLPCDIIFRRLIDNVQEAKEGENIAIIVEVSAHHRPPVTRKPYAVSCFDGKYFFDVIFFRASEDYIKSSLPVNTKRLLTGKVEQYGGKWKIVHPDSIALPENTDQFARAEPVYPLTAGVTNKCVNRVIRSALLSVPELPEWLDPDKAAQWPAWHHAIQQVHNPQSYTDLDASTPARLRLAYDEFLAFQLSLLRRRYYNPMQLQGNSLESTGHLLSKLRNALPFSLTPGQENALSDIARDMASPRQMLRLIQGDVGSGKTIVAFMAILQAVEAGFQGAFLAPTDIVARQHKAKLEPFCKTLGLRLALLTGRDKGKKRQQILQDLANRKIDILVGTHAIIEDCVEFGKLGLAVIDEQHRFGVNQRLKLAAKGNNPDILSMTATPIPRTLVLANYGDMDITLIRDKPAGRQPIDTKALPLSRLMDVIEGVKRAISTGAKIYWICPLVEESEKIDLAAATERFTALSALFPGQTGLVHGKMKSGEKDKVMDEFIQGSVDILVATTVIEVGVDVPAASIMVIEHAERFGLAQLHQLRGRIGRGTQTAVCLLLYSQTLSAVGRKRLEIMRQTNDGFVISEQDLKLRGGGEVAGTRQSGLPRFRLADFASQPDLFGDLLAMAHKDALQICREDCALASPRGHALRLLLALHRREDATRYSRSG